MTRREEIRDMLIALALLIAGLIMLALMLLVPVGLIVLAALAWGRWGW